MGILRDLLDTIPTWKEYIDKAGGKMTQKRYSSIATRAKEGILQFQVIASDSIDMDILTMISKALERQYSTFVQVVYSMHSVANINDQQGIEDYLQQFHQNEVLPTDLKRQIINQASRLAESYNQEQLGQIIVETVICEGSSNKVVYQNKEYLRDVLESFRKEKLNDKFNPYNTTMEATRTSKRTVDTFDYNYDEVRGTYIPVNRKSRTEYIDEPDKEEEPEKRVISLPNKVLTDNDVKKSNELIPTTLTLRINYQDNTGKIVGTQDFIIGVKTILHPVSSSEMVANLSTVSKGKMFNFIRCTTGEISFFKDFLLAIDESKTDVVNRSNGSSGWWIALKRRSTLAKLKRNLYIGKQLLPNATIIASKEEADYIKINTGIDILDPSFIKTIMDKYFLLGFVVVDKSMQVAYFMFDGDRELQTLSFSALERENSNKGNDFKEMLKLINRY